MAGLELSQIFMQAMASKRQQEQMEWERARTERMDKQAAEERGHARKDAAERNKRMFEARRAAAQGDYSLLDLEDPELSLKFRADDRAGQKLKTDSGAEQKKQEAAFRFNAARQMVQDPTRIEGLQAEAQQRGVQLPGEHMLLRPDLAGPQIMPDVAAERANMEAAGAKVEGLQSAESLRKEVMGSKLFNNAQEVKIARDKVVGAPANGVGDMSLVYGVVKMEDPSSSVKEGEYDQAKDTAGAYGRFGSLLKWVTGGGSLTDAQRKDLKAEGARLYAKQRATLDPQLDEFRKLAYQNGIANAEMAPALDIWGEEKQAGAPAPVAPPPGKPSPRPRPMPAPRVSNVRNAYQKMVSEGVPPQEALAKLVQAKAITPEQAQALATRLGGQ